MNPKIITVILLGILPPAKLSAQQATDSIIQVLQEDPCTLYLDTFTLNGQSILVHTSDYGSMVLCDFKTSGKKVLTYCGAHYRYLFDDLNSDGSTDLIIKTNKECFVALYDTTTSTYHWLNVPVKLSGVLYPLPEGYFYTSHCSENEPDSCRSDLFYIGKLNASRIGYASFERIETTKYVLSIYRARDQRMIRQIMFDSDSGKSDFNQIMGASWLKECALLSR